MGLKILFVQFNDTPAKKMNLFYFQAEAVVLLIFVVEVGKHRNLKIKSFLGSGCVTVYVWNPKLTTTITTEDQ